MVSATRLERLSNALSVDQVLSVPQVRRHYRVLKKDIPNIYGVFSSHVKETYYAERVRKVSFVAAQASTARLSTHELRHLAGVAEMRHFLGAPPDAWSLSTKGDTAVPDALWIRPDMEVAVEFDAGSYSRERIIFKAQAYRRFGTQVWGSSSRARLGFLKTILDALDVSATFVYAPWAH